MVDQKEWSNTYLARWKAICRRRFLKKEEPDPIPDKRYSVDYKSKLKMAMDAVNAIFDEPGQEKKETDNWVPGKKTRRKQQKS